MKKLITLVLIGALFAGAYHLLAPRLARNKAESAMGTGPVISRESIADNLLNESFISIVSDEQLEKIVEKLEQSNLLAEDGTLRSFLRKQELSPETFLENLKNRGTLGKLKDQFTEFLAEKYCEEKGISRQEVSQEDLQSYQKEIITNLVGQLLDQLKEAK